MKATFLLTFALAIAYTTAKGIDVINPDDMDSGNGDLGFMNQENPTTKKSTLNSLSKLHAP